MFFIRCKISAIFSRINSDNVCDYGIISPEKVQLFYLEVRNQLSVLNAKLNESIQGMNIVQVFRQEKTYEKRV